MRDSYPHIVVFIVALRKAQFKRMKLMDILILNGQNATATLLYARYGSA